MSIILVAHAPYFIGSRSSSLGSRSDGAKRRDHILRTLNGNLHVRSCPAFDRLYNLVLSTSTITNSNTISHLSVVLLPEEKIFLAAVAVTSSRRDPACSPSYFLLRPRPPLLAGGAGGGGGEDSPNEGHPLSWVILLVLAVRRILRFSSSMYSIAVFFHHLVTPPIAPRLSSAIFRYLDSCCCYLGRAKLLRGKRIQLMIRNS